MGTFLAMHVPKFATWECGISARGGERKNWIQPVFATGGVTRSIMSLSQGKTFFWLGNHSFRRRIVNGIRRATGDLGRTLAANVGEGEIAVVSIVYQALAVTGMAIESVGIEGTILTSFNAFETFNAGLMEAEFSFGPRRRLQG